jgi:hypothetical protein
MTPPGRRIDPGLTENRERLMLEVKYRIFQDSIQVQRGWRAMINQVLGDPLG